MKLSSMAKIILENEDAGLSVDEKMTEKTLTDTFDLTTNGLEYLKGQLEKLKKRAGRIGVPAPEYKIVSERDVKEKDPDTALEKTTHIYTVKIEGKAPIIDGYEFIANIEHTSAGNIIHLSPSSSVKKLPSEYHTSTPTCDYCHTKRDRLNTFVLKKTDNGEFMKVGRSCLKNFLPGKDPKEIIEYANWLSFILTAAIGAEGMGDDSGEDYRGQGGRSKYYNSDDFLVYVCLAYLMEGRYISKSKASETETPTANYAMNLMYMKWGTASKSYEDKVKSLVPKAQKMAEDLIKWKDEKDWDGTIQAKPEMADYFHNLKIISKSPAVQYRNSGLHASLLAIYLREKAWAEKNKSNSQTPKSYVGNIGEKIEFTGVLKKVKTFPSQYGETWMYQFSDSANNDIVWFASKGVIAEESVNETFTVKATVKAHVVSKWTQQPQTIITRAKVIQTSRTPFVEKDQWGNPVK